MKYADIASLTEKELMKRSKDLQGQIFEARMKNSLGQLANPMTIREMRRDIARLHTALSAKSATGAKAGKAASAAKSGGTPKTKARGKAKASAKA